MLIANPIYDVVFNYLMEDLTVAKYLISHIIDKEITELVPSPTTVPIKFVRSLHVYRMDYAATIKTEKNESYKVIIEVQKSFVIEDILRFREYLGKQYSRYFIEKPKDKRSTKTEKYLKEKKLTHPIITIYFLGNKLETMTQPVINIKRHYYDAATGNQIKGTENFIEQLTHDCHIIQIPYLPLKKQTELEHILSVFNQHYVVNLKSPHRLEIPNEKISKVSQLLVRRLMKAQSSIQLEEIMNIEDKQYDLKKKMQMQEKELKSQEKELKNQSEELKNQSEELKNQSEELKNQDKELKKKDKKLEKEKAEKEKLRLEKEKIMAFLIEKGIDYKI